MDRRSLLAALALATLMWLCLSGNASAAAPANDDFANAATLSGLPANATGTNVDATTEPGEPELAVTVGTVPSEHSVWWNWIAPSDGDVTLDTCASDIDTALAVFTGDSVNALTPVARHGSLYFDCESPLSGSGGVKISFTAHSGQVYRIVVASVRPDFSTGAIALSLYQSPRPANDDFANAAPLTEDTNETSFGSGTIAGATKEAGEPNHAGDPGGRSVWWSWTAPRSGVVRFDAWGDFAMLLAVYTGNAVGALSEVGSAGAHPAGSVSFRARAGVTYHIAVDRSGASMGVVGLDKYAVSPPNDDFEYAAPLSGLSDDAFVDIRGATSEPGEPNHAGNAAGHSVWWRWTAPVDGPVQIDTCASLDPDTVIAVYTGDALDALSPVARNDDLASCGHLSGVGFTASAGTTYRIAVDAAAGSSPVYAGVSLRETAPPASAPPSATAPATGIDQKTAIKKCKKKHSKAARKKCRRQATTASHLGRAGPPIARGAGSKS